MARVILSKLATMYELQTIYGSEDFYNFLEIIAVDIYNQNQLNTED
jgi:hypothetical protein